MAAEVTISQALEITSLAGGDEFVNHKFTSGTTPVETVQGKPIIADSAVTLDFGDIAAGSGYLLYVEALVGNVYILFNGAADATPILTTAELYIKAGEGYILPINPNATAMARIRLISDSATGQIKYFLVGS